MTELQSLLDSIRSRNRRFTVYRPTPEQPYETWFRNHNVDVEYRKLPAGSPGSFLAIEHDGAFVGAIGLDDLDTLLESPIVPPDRRADVSEGYRVLFDVLSDTVFTAMTRRELLAVSREIEERAYRVGSGALYVSFQKFSTFESQIGVYRHLAAETDIEIHIYGHPDWTPPEIEGVTYHCLTGDPRQRYWALAFNSESAAMQASGLLAREDPPDSYTGFWTNDPALVSKLRAGLTANTVN
ncbi:DICT sensory domain-containing protein [Halobellus salinisoli]|uniref:DICT sensory domain-containing protein n=1 Tax=Halobellus salinisoli TaxID=3108500 RepID=UPI0030084439